LKSLYYDARSEKHQITKLYGFDTKSKSAFDRFKNIKPTIFKYGSQSLIQKHESFWCRTRM